MGKGTKRRKPYYVQFSKKIKESNILSPNCTGFLCTCSNTDRAVREAYNLLGEYADKLYGSEGKPKSVQGAPCYGNTTKEHKSNFDIESDEEEDIEDALQAELAALRSDPKGGPVMTRFRKVHCGVANCLFIATSLPDPGELTLAIMDDIIHTLPDAIAEKIDQMQKPKAILDR